MSAKRIASSILWVGLALAFWQGIAYTVHNDRIAPSLGNLINEAYPGFAIFGNSSSNSYGEATRVLAWHALQTAKRATWGIIFGGVSGIAAGLTVFALGRGRSSARLLLLGLMNVPLFSLIPLFIYWFSGEQFGIVLYVALAVGVLVATATFEAGSNVPLTYFWQASLAGAQRMTVLWSVVLPAIIPELLLTFRWVLGLIWAFALGAEYLSSDSSGCGFLVYQSYLYSDVGQLLVLGAVYAVLGYSSICIFDFATKRLLPEQLLTTRR